MLDICIPFNWFTKSSISATNGSCISSRTSSCRLRSPPLSKSGTVTSSAPAPAVPATKGSEWLFRFRSWKRRSSRHGHACCQLPLAESVAQPHRHRIAPPDANAHGRGHCSASSEAEEELRLPLARLHLTRRGSGGRGHCWYEIEPTDNGRNELLPWNLLGQEWWPSKVWEGQSGLLLEPSEPK